MNKENKSFEHDFIMKSAQVSSNTITETELAKINKFTLAPLTTEEVFTFKVVMCDNEIDRAYEVFPINSLQTLAKLYVGKTFIKDHTRKSDNQVARIYDTELVQDGVTVSKNGEVYTQLVAHCYMVVTESNKDLIAEIKGGIKKEVSVGCGINKAVCSICGTDNHKEYCKHYWGIEYEGKTCHYSLEEPKDAYELSFVAVPCQPQAGTRKSYGGVDKSLEKPKPKEQENQLNKEKHKEFDVKLQDIGSFLFAEKYGRLMRKTNEQENA